MKRNTGSPFVIVTMVLFMICVFGFWGCGEQNDPVVAAVNPNDSGSLFLAPTCIFWPWASEAAKNEAIVNKAREEAAANNNTGKVYICAYDDSNVGQCKWWVQNQLIPKASYNLAKIIPNNDLVHPVYYRAKWLDEGVSNVRIVLRASGTCFVQFPTSIIKSGNVFQLRWKKGGLHTFVVDAIAPTYIDCIDCNWDNACNAVKPKPNSQTTITKHRMSLDYFNSNVAAYTLYQIL